MDSTNIPIVKATYITTEGETVTNASIHEPEAIVISPSNSSNEQAVEAIPIATNIDALNNTLPIAYATSIDTTMPVNFNNHLNSEFTFTPTMSFVWRLSKTIKCISIIDIFFCLFYVLIDSRIALISILPILGYCGAKEYNTCKIYSYFIFVLMIICIRITAYREITTISGSLFCILSILIELWILRILYLFIKYIKLLDPLELLQLKNPNLIPLESGFVLL